MPTPRPTMPQSQVSIQLLQLPTMYWRLVFFLGREFCSCVNTSHTAMGWQNLPPYHFPPTSIWSEQILNRNSRVQMFSFTYEMVSKLKFLLNIARWTEISKMSIEYCLNLGQNNIEFLLSEKEPKYIAYAAFVHRINQCLWTLLGYPSCTKGLEQISWRYKSKAPPPSKQRLPSSKPSSEAVNVIFKLILYNSSYYRYHIRSNWH